ncbi:hypothetical protein, partial [Pseudomonas syringae]|uniref:hypothetical protein n=1 Tax=Pseudomonas syringae TaxID=317 RepID=UPI001F42B626
FFMGAFLRLELSFRQAFWVHFARFIGFLRKIAEFTSVNELSCRPRRTPVLLRSLSDVPPEGAFVRLSDKFYKRGGPPWA